MAGDLEERQALRAKLIGADLCPAIVTLVAIVMVLFLVGYVVPQVANVFAGSKRALALLTQIIVGISAMVHNYGRWILAAIVLASVAGVYIRRIPEFRIPIDAAFLNVPVIGRLARGYNAARFVFMLAVQAGASRCRPEQVCQFSKHC